MLCTQSLLVAGLARNPLFTREDWVSLLFDSRPKKYARFRNYPNVCCGFKAFHFNMLQTSNPPRGAFQARGPVSTSSIVRTAVWGCIYSGASLHTEICRPIRRARQFRGRRHSSRVRPTASDRRPYRRCGLTSPRGACPYVGLGACSSGGVSGCCCLRTRRTHPTKTASADSAGRAAMTVKEASSWLLAGAPGRW